MCPERPVKPSSSMCSLLRGDAVQIADGILKSGSTSSPFPFRAEVAHLNLWRLRCALAPRWARAVLCIHRRRLDGRPRDHKRNV
jgi:hypothetical protein